MKVCLLQCNTAQNAVNDFGQRMERLMDHEADADIYVLPELFAESGMAQEWMLQTARLKNAAVAGSLKIVEDNHTFNRFLFVTPEGVVAAYDKRHLFTMGGERKLFSAGTERVVTQWRGVNCLLQVCYDLRFPVFSRNHGDYDAILYVANWPTARIEAWKTLLQARAIENQCYVVGVNNVGSIDNIDYGGMSMAFDAYGRKIAECDSQTECTATCNIDIPHLQAFRQKFPVLVDADDFLIKKE